MTNGQKYSDEFIAFLCDDDPYRYVPDPPPLGDIERAIRQDGSFEPLPYLGNEIPSVAAQRLERDRDWGEFRGRMRDEGRVYFPGDGNRYAGWIMP